MAKSSASSNAAHAKRISDAHAAAEKAQARVSLERARAEVKGKQVIYDYTPTGVKIKVVDRPKR